MQQRVEDESTQTAPRCDHEGQARIPGGRESRVGRELVEPQLHMRNNSVLCGYHVTNLDQLQKKYSDDRRIKALFLEWEQK